MVLTVPNGLAQPSDMLSRTELTLRVGGMNYCGDLNDQSLLGEVNMAGGVGLRVRLDNRWTVRVEGDYGTIAATEDVDPKRNLSFRSPLVEGGLLAEFNFQSYGGGATDWQWTPYIFGGVGVFHYNPRAKYVDTHGDVQWADLQPLHTEGQGTNAYPDRRPYRLTQLAMPFGLGVRLRLGKYFSLSAEYGFRKTWIDYLDDVSTTYADPAVLRAEVENGSLAAQLADRSEVANRPGIKRGDDSLPDWYSFFNIAVGVNLDPLFGWMRQKKCRN